jgi:hypothetical protein
LNEAECYTRLYGDRESTVTVLRDDEPPAGAADPLGDHLRRLFEERVDRPGELRDAEAA